MKKHFIVLMCLVLISSTFVFAGGKKESSKATQDNGVLRLLTWSGYALPEQIEKFEEETGIKVEVIKSNNEEMIAKLRATRGGGFDLAQPSQDRIIGVQKQYDVYQPIDFSKVNVDQIDSVLLEAVKKNTKIEDEYYGLPHIWGTSGLIVNKKYCNDVEDYSDLFNPKYKGRISYRLVRATVCGVSFSLGNEHFKAYNDLDKYQTILDQVQDKLVDGKDLVQNYWANGDSLLQSMKTEEVWLAMAWDQAGWKLHALNPDIDFIPPKSGAMAWIDTFAIPSKSKNVEAAYRWINFALEPENAAYFTNHETYATASKGAEKFYTEDIKANFARGYNDEAKKNFNWYPAAPPGIEEMEGKMLDKVRASK